MEQIGTGPDKDGHEVVADDLDAEFAQVADALLVVFDVLVPGGQADLDVVVDIDRFHNIHIEAVLIQLPFDLGNLLNLPNFTGHLVMQCPDDAGDTGDLLNVTEFDLVVAFAIPAETHLHWHMYSSVNECIFLAQGLKPVYHKYLQYKLRYLLELLLKLLYTTK